MISVDLFLDKSRLTSTPILSLLVCCVFYVMIIYGPIYALKDFHFSVVGDWGCNEHSDSTIDSIISMKPEFVLALGDFSYYPTGTCWFNKIVPIDDVTKITIGNHEDESIEGYGGYMSHFGLEQTYYSFTHQNVHFLAMDSERNNFLIGSDQYKFVKNDLQKASRDPGIDWIITYFHKPLYSSPYISVDDSFRNTYQPLFDRYGVDLILQGHFHNYQRTFPLKFNFSTPSNPIVADTNANKYSNPDGPIFVIVGTGGINMHPLSGKASFVSSQQDYFFGHLDVKITGNGTKLEGKFYRNSGHIDDAFSITKGIEYTPPTAKNKNITVTKNSQQTIELAGSDFNNNLISYTIEAQPTNGSLFGTADNLIYIPKRDFVGFDKFTFKVNNSALESNIATVNIKVEEASQENGYNFSPRLLLTGSQHYDVQSSHLLQLTEFSVGAWFKTSSDYVSDAFIVNKGGSGSDSAGQNQNYGIWMTRSGNISAGFEAIGGADHFVTSPNTYNDGQWHYALVTYDGSNIILYLDGEKVDTVSTAGALPENAGTKPVRVGANSRTDPGEKFFVGEVDEVRIWNSSLAEGEVLNALSGESSDQSQIMHLSFSDLPPTANIQTVTTARNTPKAIALTGTDPKGEPLTYILVTPPSNGNLSGESQNLVYTPNMGYAGFDNFEFKVNNSAHESNVAIVNISVYNSPPIVVSQDVTIIKNNDIDIALEATDENKDFLNYSVVTSPTKGTLSGNGTRLEYHPHTDYVGADFFSFAATDGIAESNKGTVSITVRDPEIEKYNYSPGLVLTGTNYVDRSSSTQLQLSQFTIAAWFKTSSEYVSNAYIINKGGTGSENPGENQNYGIWMTGNGRIRGGFEVSTGENQLVSSTRAYNDGQWHYALVTYDGSTLTLYVDGERIDTTTSNTIPDKSGDLPLRIGANSRLTSPGNLFIGEVDEVRIWNVPVTAEQADQAYLGSFDTAGQIVYLNFGS